jgi:protein-S-isoprenylcysteine O-methyltransferase Ste14
VGLAKSQKGVPPLGRKWISLAAYIILVVALICLIVRHSILGSGPAAVLIQILAILLIVWARLTFGLRSFHAAANPTQEGHVTRGPYRYLRHPIYASVLYIVWAGAVSHASAINLTLTVVVTIALAVRIHEEEIFLVSYYPEYVRYSRRTKRIIPFLM